MNEEHPLERAATVLNQGLQLDREALTALVNQKVRCNKELAMKSGILVRPALDNAHFETDIMGVLSGIFGEGKKQIGVDGEWEDGKCKMIFEFVVVDL